MAVNHTDQIGRFIGAGIFERSTIDLPSLFTRTEWANGKDSNLVRIRLRAFCTSIKVGRLGTGIDSAPTHQRPVGLSYPASKLIEPSPESSGA
jgi:hypothetical protein